MHMYILRYFCKYNECKKISGKGQSNLTLKKETNVFKKKKTMGLPPSLLHSNLGFFSL